MILIFKFYEIMFSSIFTTRKKYMLFKEEVSKLLLLSSVCFRDLFEIRITNFLRANDSPGSFFSLSAF